MAGSVEEIERAVREWLVEFSPSDDRALTDG